MSLARFIEKWSSADHPSAPVSEADFGLVEDKFAVRLPAAYRQAVLQLGLPRPTISLLDAIVERELDLQDVSDFHSPAEIIEITLDWREAGMPEELIAFASDCCGNQFCFDAAKLRTSSAAGDSIWFFDHDFGTTEQIASDFDAWIAELCDVEPWPEAKPS